MKPYNELTRLTKKLLEEMKEKEISLDSAKSIENFLDYKNLQNRLPDAEDAVTVLSCVCNGGINVKKQFVDTLSREHRTLQQSATGVMMAWIEHLSSLPENLYDGRNELSVMLAHQIIGYIKFRNLVTGYISRFDIEKDSRIQKMLDKQPEFEDLVKFIDGLYDLDVVVGKLPCI